MHKLSDELVALILEWAKPFCTAEELVEWASMDKEIMGVLKNNKLHPITLFGILALLLKHRLNIDADFKQTLNLLACVCCRWRRLIPNTNWQLKKTGESFKNWSVNKAMLYLKDKNVFEASEKKFMSKKIGNVSNSPSIKVLRAMVPPNTFVFRDDADNSNCGAIIFIMVKQSGNHPSVAFANLRMLQFFRDQHAILYETQQENADFEAFHPMSILDPNCLAAWCGV